MVCCILFRVLVVGQTAPGCLRFVQPVKPTFIASDALPWESRARNTRLHYSMRWVLTE